MSHDVMCHDCRGKLDQQALSDARQLVDDLRRQGKHQAADRIAVAFGIDKEQRDAET